MPKRCTCKYMLLSIFLTLRLTMLFNFSSFECVQVFTLPTLLLQSASVCCPRSFGYPAPHLDQWQQRVWYDLGATQKYYIRCIFAFHEAFPRPPVLQGPSHLLPLAGQLQHRSGPKHGGKFVKALKGESSAPSTASTGPSSPMATTFS